LTAGSYSARSTFSDIQVHSCPRCGDGALIPREDELSCLHCGAIVYPNPPDYSLTLYHENGRKRRDRASQSMAYDDRWMQANQHVIVLLSQGLSNRRIGAMLNVDPRQVQKVREAWE
jgi:Zn-finger nucleic acid-binding protein